jgi:uncharacterized protein
MNGVIRRHGGLIASATVYLAAWAGAVTLLAATGSDGAGDALAVFVIFGLVFCAIGWLTTLGRPSVPVPVRRPRLEAALVLAYLAAYAVFFTGFGLNAFHAAFPAGRSEALLLAAFKLAVHVALPAALLLAAGASLAPLFAGRPGGRAFWLSLVVLGAAILAVMSVISPSLKQIAALGLRPGSLALASAGAFVWIAIEAGLCEEFLFRAVLQTRLAAVMKSELGAVLIAALVFALVHVPGLWMRGSASDAGHAQSLLQVIAYAVAVLSPAGVFLGFMWYRTRNLLLVVLLHALVDVLPFIPEFAHRWL